MILEKDAIDLSGHDELLANYTRVAALSQAVSLKRIADAIEAIAGAATELNEYGEGPIRAIGANIARALR